MGYMLSEMSKATHDHHALSVTPVLMYGHCEPSVRNDVNAVIGMDTVALSAAAGTFTVTSAAALVQAQIIVALDAEYTAEPEPTSSWDEWISNSMDERTAR
jgi:hypothetical protein